MAATAIDSLRGILNGFRDLNSKGLYTMNGTETDLLRQILLEVQDFPLSGTLINGVANFYQSAKPTTRVDGSALVDGDVWYNPSNTTQYFWNTTNGWLTAELTASFSFGNVTLSSTGGTYYLLSRTQRAVLITELFASFYVPAGSLNGTDFWTFWLTTTGASGNIASTDVTAGDSGVVTFNIIKTVSGLSLAVPLLSGGFLGVSPRKNAAAPNIGSVTYGIKYREVAP